MKNCPGDLQEPASSSSFTYFDEISRVQGLIDTPELERRLLERGIFRSKELTQVQANSMLSRFKVMNVENKGAVITYRVLLGSFVMSLLLLNVEHKARQSNKRILYQSRAVAIIELISKCGRPYIGKRLRFRQDESVLRYAQDRIQWTAPGNFLELQQVLHEVAIGKICDALGVGPRTGSPDHGFDVVCYPNAMEFYVQLCKPLHQYVDYAIEIADEIENRLLYCMRVMHRYRLIHKDIKPQNVLYSHSRKQLVLADFGISTQITQSESEKTKTCREGTLAFMSPEMVQLKRGGTGFVNLYENDLFSLKVTMEKVKERQRQERTVGPWGETTKVEGDEMRTDEEALVYTYEIYSNPNQKVQILKNASQNKTFGVNLSQYFAVEGDSRGQSGGTNVQFLIRSMGLGLTLQEYLQLETNYVDQRVMMLQAKLSNRHQMPGLSMDCEPKSAYSLLRLSNYFFKELDQIEKDQEKYSQDDRQLCQLLLSLLPAYTSRGSSAQAESMLERIKGHIHIEFKEELKKWELLLRINGSDNCMKCIDEVLESTDVELRMGLFGDICETIYMELHDSSILIKILERLPQISTQQKSGNPAQVCKGLFKKLVDSTDPNKQSKMWNSIVNVALIYYSYHLMYEDIHQIVSQYRGRVPLFCELTLQKWSCRVNWSSQLKPALSNILQCEVLTKKLYGEFSSRYLQVVLQKARLLMNFRKYKEALDQFNRLSSTTLLMLGTQNFDSFMCYIDMAVCLLHMGSIATAKEYAVKAAVGAKRLGLKKLKAFQIILDRALFDYMYCLAVNTEKEYLETRRVLMSHVYQKHPYHSNHLGYYCRFNYLIAQIELKLNNVESAVQYLKRAITLFEPSPLTKPFQREALQSLSEVYINMGLLNEAASALDQLELYYVKQDIDQLLQSLCYNALLWMKCKRPDKAKQQLNLISEGLHDSPHLRGELKGEYFTAAAAMAVTQQCHGLAQRFLSILRGDSSYHFSAGLCQLKSGNYQAAIADFQRFIESEQSSQNEEMVGHSYRHIAQANKKLGRASTAVEYFDKAITLYRKIIADGLGDKQACYDNIGICLMDSDRRPEALLELHRAVVLCIRSKSMVYAPILHAVECHLKMGAFRRMNSLLRLLPNRSVFYRRLGNLIYFDCFSMIASKKSKRLYELINDTRLTDADMFGRVVAKLQDSSLKDSVHVTLLGWLRNQSKLPQDSQIPYSFNSQGHIWANSDKIRKLTLVKQVIRALLRVPGQDVSLIKQQLKLLKASTRN